MNGTNKEKINPKDLSILRCSMLQFQIETEKHNSAFFLTHSRLFLFLSLSNTVWLFGWCVVENKKNNKNLSCERENRNKCIDAVAIRVLSKTLKKFFFLTYSFFSDLCGFWSKKLINFNKIILFESFYLLYTCFHRSQVFNYSSICF